MEVVHCKISKEITLCGFVDLVEVASPPAISRHLVLPVHGGSSSKGTAGNETSITELSKTEGEPDEDLTVLSSEEGKNPSFCVLLHGALKVTSFLQPFKKFQVSNFKYDYHRWKIWEQFAK